MGNLLLKFYDNTALWPRETEAQLPNLLVGQIPFYPCH